MTQEESSALSQTAKVVDDLHVPHMILGHYLYFQLDFDNRGRFNQ